MVIAKNATELGHIIRSQRKAQALTQPELAAASGVGVRFIVDLEGGKETCQLGKVLKVASMLGLSFNVEN